MAVLRDLLVPSALALVLAMPAAAATSRFEARTFTEPAKPGLPVSGALTGYAATATAHVVVPLKWRPRSAGAGRLRFVTTQNPSCRYSLTYAVRSVIAAPGTAADFVARALPAASSRHLLDSGQHGGAAWRVVRQPGIGGQVRVDALWAGVLTRRADIVPAGDSAWAQIRVTARSRKGDECHAGTWREALGPEIGDSLAVARVKLHFTRAG
jgi:hypothetical protein